MEKNYFFNLLDITLKQVSVNWHPWSLYLVFLRLFLNLENAYCFNDRFILAANVKIVWILRLDKVKLLECYLSFEKE